MALTLGNSLGPSWMRAGHGQAFPDNKDFRMYIGPRNTVPAVDGGVSRCVPEALLGGSWVVISGVISPQIWVIAIVTLLVTPLITNHEPPSKP